MKKALISVCDKKGILGFARELAALNYTLLCTKGTALELEREGVAAQKIEEYVGVPELLGGKVKTLHPKLFAEILGGEITLVAVNLYPLGGEIDIGGCALLRAAAKNYENVLVLCDPEDYREALERLQSGVLDKAYRRSLAAKVFRLTAAYDAALARDLGGEIFPEKLTLSFCKSAELAYGENPFQRGALYLSSTEKPLQIQGKPLTFNNLLDADAAVEIAGKFTEPACAIIKHNNPCGVAVKGDSCAAFMAAYGADPLCAFGGVVAFNCLVDEATAKAFKFLDLVIAPAYEEGALKVLSGKPNLRILQSSPSLPRRMTFKEISGGLLCQTYAPFPLREEEWQIVTEKQPTQQQLTDLLFAAKVNQEVKSNSVVIAKDSATVGVGAGQMSRVDSTFMALYKAKERAAGAVLSSDGFFPFADSIELAAKAGIVAIIQPGGSKRDGEVIAACNQFGIAMVFTGKRLFKH